MKERPSLAFPGKDTATAFGRVYPNIIPARPRGMKFGFHTNKCGRVAVAYFFSVLAAHCLENSPAFFKVSGVNASLFASRLSTVMTAVNALA